MTSVLETILYRRSQLNEEPVEFCIWHGLKKPATWRDMTAYGDGRKSKPPVNRIPMSLLVHGDAPLYAEISQRRFLHTNRFISLAHLDLTSPARAVAVYVLARLFPQRWYDLYKKGFNQELDQRVVSNVSRFNATMVEPTCHELLEIAMLHPVFVRASSSEKATLANSRSELFKTIGEIIPGAFRDKRSHAFHLILFFAISSYSLTHTTKEQFIDYLDFNGQETRRNLDLILTAWKESTAVPLDAYVSCAISQFRLK